MSNDQLTKALVALISLNHLSFFDESYASLLNELSEKARVQRVKIINSAIRVLSEEPRPTAVLVTDEALTEKKNGAVWDAVLQYTREGGTTIVMGHFSSFAKPPNIKLFFSKADLPWESGSYYRTTSALNREAVPRDLVQRLPAEYCQKALFVKNVARSDAGYQTDENSVVESHVFAPTSAHVVEEALVALARVGEGRLGYLGYLGDVNAESGSDAVIIAMCGLAH